jgi:hypothetical protein
MPSTNDDTTPCPACRDPDIRLPTATSGLASRSAKPGHSSARPNPPSTISAAMRPYSLASTAQAPPTAASDATAANIAAMPSSIGTVLRQNERSARANTKGRTGRMHGLTMVRIPPR